MYLIISITCFIHNPVTLPLATICLFSIATIFLFCMFFHLLCLSDSTSMNSHSIHLGLFYIAYYPLDPSLLARMARFNSFYIIYLYLYLYLYIVIVLVTELYLILLQRHGLLPVRLHMYVSHLLSIHLMIGPSVASVSWLL